MSQPFIFPYRHALRAVALLVTAVLLLPASSFRDAHAADPPGDASVSGPNKKARMNEHELVNMRGCLLQILMVDDPKFREARAAWKAAQARSEAEIAKDPRSAAAGQAYKDASEKWYVQEHLAHQRSDAYAKLVFNWLSLQALYAPPTLSKRLEELAEQIEIALKTSYAVRTEPERDVLFATHLRDAQTIHTLGQILMTAEHCRPDAAARILREVDQLESEFKATLQEGRDRLTKLAAEEPFAIELDPQELKRELRLVEIRSAMLDELALTNAELQQTQSDLEATNDAHQKASMQIEPQKTELAQRQAQLQTVLDGLRKQQAALRGEPDAQKKARLQVALDAQGKLAEQAEEKCRELAQQQAAFQVQISQLLHQKAVLQADLQLREADRSQRLDRLADNLRSMGGLHTQPGVLKRIEDRLAKTLKGRDPETVPKDADLREQELPAMQRTAQERSTQTPGESAQPQPERPPAPKVIELRLLDNERVFVNRRGKITLDEFKKRLGDAMAGYKQQGIQPSAIRVHLSAAENVSCGRFEQLIKDCWENRIEHYVLTIEAIFLEPAPRDKRLETAPPVNVMFSLPREANAVAEEAVPPFSIRLSAKEDGSLAGIRVGEIQFRWLVQLHTWAIELKHKADGPHAPLTAEFDTEEKLAFKYLAEAVLAVSVEVDPFHKLWPLIENVVPIRLPEVREKNEESEGVIDPSDNPETSPPPSIQLDNIKLDPQPKK